MTFDPIRGWVTPEDDYIGDTTASLKDIIKTVKSDREKPDALYNDVERVLFTYCFSPIPLIRHGRVRHERRVVEWHLVESLRKPDHALICYFDGGEWFDDCYADEIPVWLLLTILRKIQRCKPLGDQKTNETIKAV